MDGKSYYHDTAETIMWNDRHRMKTNALQKMIVFLSMCLVFQYIETFFSPDALT